MNRKYVIDVFSGKGIDEAIRGIEQHKKWLENGATKLVELLSEHGLSVARAGFDTAVYDGNRGDISLTVDDRGALQKAVVALGGTVLFIEFGTGVTYPDNHPEASKNGMVRGAYGKGRGKQHTWGFYGEETGTNGKFATNKKGEEKIPHVVLTHGNPANMPMYNAVRGLEQEFARMVKEAFPNY